MVTGVFPSPLPIQHSHFKLFLLVNIFRISPSHDLALSATKPVTLENVPKEQECALGKVRTRIVGYASDKIRIPHRGCLYMIPHIPTYSSKTHNLQPAAKGKPTQASTERGIYIYNIATLAQLVVVGLAKPVTSKIQHISRARTRWGRGHLRGSNSGNRRGQNTTTPANGMNASDMQHACPL